MAEIVDPGASESPQKGQKDGQSQAQTQTERPAHWFKPGVSGNPTGAAKANAGQPMKPPILVDLEWAYKNVDTKVQPKNAQQELFRGDFIQDREKTLKLLVGLQKEYRDRMKLWRDKIGATAGATTAGGGTSSLGSGAGGVLAADEGEERVREMMKRLLEEANGEALSPVPEGDAKPV